MILQGLLVAKNAKVVGSLKFAITAAILKTTNTNHIPHLGPQQ